VARQSPISATAEHLCTYLVTEHLFAVVAFVLSVTVTNG